MKLSGGKLVRKTAFAGTDIDADGSLRAFVAKAGIKGLTWSSCTSYSLLKKKAKAASGSKKTGLTSTNKKAHAAYRKKKPWKLRNSQGTTNPPSSAFVDLTDDGVDEMIVSWWPSICTYRNGKAVRVEKGYIGSDNAYRAYKKAKVIMKSRSDAMGGIGYTYKKWNGKKFVTVAILYTPSGYGINSPSYWTKASGYTTKAKAEAYVKELTGNAKASRIKFKENW